VHHRNGGSLSILSGRTFASILYQMARPSLFTASRSAPLLLLSDGLDILVVHRTHILKKHIHTVSPRYDHRLTVFPQTLAEASLRTPGRDELCIRLDSLRSILEGHGCGAVCLLHHGLVEGKICLSFWSLLEAYCSNAPPFWHTYGFLYKGAKMVL
jgi:hypothetical protein